MRTKEDVMATAKNAANIFENLTTAFRRQGMTSTSRSTNHPPRKIQIGNVSGLMRIWWTLEAEIISNAKVILVVGRSIEEPVLTMTYTSALNRWTIEVSETPIGTWLHIPARKDRVLDGEELRRHVQHICSFVEAFRSPPTVNA
jgi:hypothetical protein